MVPSHGPYIHNITFRNITTYGDSGCLGKERGKVVLRGLADRHDVAGITFDNVNYYGCRITAVSPYVHTDGVVRNVSFVGESE